ncbi:unnamed protein product [Enterobius vermicularis]|uniref:Homeobox domain-containing protein n=1 Tax=Enterobius vermicularis TaxID=51028 RepID=A0A0N4VDS1_ENTVE|nr:unnamed protein product [Enterobius vermicularis]
MTEERGTRCLRIKRRDYMIDLNGSLSNQHISKLWFPKLLKMRLAERLEEKRSAVRSDDQELDELILNAIFTLRIHLIELSKVFDLCVDFKLKYMQSLKKKINQETMIGLSGDSDEDSAYQAGPLIFNEQRLFSDLQARNSTLAMLATANGMVTIPLGFFNASGLPSPQLCGPVVGPGSSSSSTFFLQREPKPKAKENSKHSNRCSGPGGDTRPQRISEDDERNELKRKLPPKAVDLLKTWFYQHAAHPYPTDNEKCELSTETGLHITQINNWFINARRRIISNKTPNASTQDSDEFNESEWNTAAVKKQRKDSGSGSCSYMVDSFFTESHRLPNVKD